MDPVNTAPVNTLFWNLVSGWKNLKTLCSGVDSESAYFAYRWRHRPTHRPLAFKLWTPCHLITTIMVDYMLVFVLQKILLGLLGQNILLLCHHAEQKRIMDNWLTIYIFFLLCSVSPSTVRLFTVRKFYAHAPSLLLHFWWISSTTYRLEYELQCVYSFSMDPFGCKYSWNYAKEDEGKNCFDMCGHGLCLSSVGLWW